MEYGTLVPSGNRLAEKTLATLYDPFNEELKCPSVSYPAIMAFVLYIEKHGITRGLKNDSSIETALYIVWFVSVLMGDLAILKILLTGEKHVLEGKSVLLRRAIRLHTGQLC